MYYKITNKDSEAYKKLHAFRSNELAIEAENTKKVQEIVKLKYDSFFGKSGQQHLDRVKTYTGFVFTNPDEVDTKIWRAISEENITCYIPNIRTKVGKEMKKQLSSLKTSFITKFYDVLDIDISGRFIFPYLEIVAEDTLILFLDDRFEMTDENFIEITRKEFYALNQS